MKKTTALFAVLAALSATVALAGPPKKPAVKKAAKVTDVWTCPITMEKVAAGHESGKGVVVGKYRVHFCCGGCPEQFAKLSPKDKQTKAVAAAKKDGGKKDNAKKS